MIAAAVLALAFAGPAPPGIEVAVDRNVELLSIVFRLAGNPEYRMKVAESKYSGEVDAWFGKAQDHEAIALAKALRAQHGVSFDAVPSLALHLDADLDPRMPFDPRPLRLDARWAPKETAEFLVALKAFRADTRADEFFAAHEACYREAGKRLAAAIGDGGGRAREWFDAFFGAKASASFRAIPSLLSGGHNFGCGVVFPDALGLPEEIRPVIGTWQWDETGMPQYDADVRWLLVHELCHSYTNRIVDRAERDFAPAGERIFAPVKAAMAKIAYGTWKIVLYETLVRAVTRRCIGEIEGDAARAKVDENDRAQGFVWVPELSQALDRYAADRKRYAKFEDFVPELVAALTKIAGEQEATAKAAPQVVRTTPVNGDLAVDPSVAELVIEFDRAMRDQSWSIVGSAADTPRVEGSPRYDAGRRTLRIPIALEPGRSYRFSLNSATKRGFVSADGHALEPYVIAFTVAAK